MTLAIDTPIKRRQLLHAALDAPGGGMLTSVADTARMRISDASYLAALMVADGLLCALDGMPWAPTAEGYRLIQDERAQRAAARARKLVRGARPAVGQE